MLTRSIEQMDATGPNVTTRSSLNAHPNQMVRKPDGGKPSISRTRELLHRRLKQRCSGGGTPKQPTHHVPFCFGEYMCMYIIQGVRRAEAMGRSQMPPLSLWLKGFAGRPREPAEERLRVFPSAGWRPTSAAASCSRIEHAGQGQSKQALPMSHDVVRRGPTLRPGLRDRERCCRARLNPHTNPNRTQNRRRRSYHSAIVNQ